MGGQDDTVTSTTAEDRPVLLAGRSMQSGVRDLRPAVEDAVLARGVVPKLQRLLVRAAGSRAAAVGRNFYRGSLAVASIAAIVGAVLAWPVRAADLLGPCESSTRFCVSLPDILILVWLAIASTLITSAAGLEQRVQEISRVRWGAQIDGHRVLSVDRLLSALAMSALALVLVAFGPWGLRASAFRSLLLGGCFYYAGIGLSAMFVVFSQVSLVCSEAKGDALLFHADRLAGFSPLVRYADRSSLAILTGALAVPMAISIIDANLHTIDQAPVRSYIDLALAVALLAIWATFSFGVSLLGRIAISTRLGQLRDEVLWNVALQKGQLQDAAGLDALDRREKAALNLQVGIISAGWWKDLLSMSGSAATALGWWLDHRAPHGSTLLSMSDLALGTLQHFHR